MTAGARNIVPPLFKYKRIDLSIDQMNYHETDAILLKYYDYGESNRLFVFFTRDFGKIKLIGKGARKSRSNQFTTLDLLTHQEVSFREDERSDLHPLLNITMGQPFVTLREDIKSLSTALYFADIIDAFFKEYEKNEAVFDLLLEFLDHLNNGGSKSSAIPTFQIKILESAGLAPDMNACIKCHRKFEAINSKYFSLISARGGFVCDDCRKGPPHDFVSLGTLKMIRLAMNASPKSIGRIKFTPHAFREASVMLGEFITYQLNWPLKTYDYLKMIGIIYLSHNT